MFSIEIIIRKIVTSLTTLFRNLKFESNIRILYKSQVISDNCSRANIDVVTERNICDVCEYEGNKYLKKYKKFIAQGDLGYYAYLDGRWVHRTWITIGPGVVNKWSHFPPFRLNAREAYCHFAETAPTARGQNISAAVLNRAAIDLKGKVDYFYTLVDENNFASRRVQEKAGFIEVKRLKRTSFLWLNFYREIILCNVRL
jgi:RimJ/RimL family protein N-acetyltransferase